MELMYQSTGTTQDAETAMTSFTPTKSGVLKEVHVYPGGTAATSLVEGGYVKLTCSKFAGVDLFCPFWGSGLRTAPAVQIQARITICNLAVEAGVPVKGFYYYNTTPTTPELMVYGVFEG